MPNDSPFEPLDETENEIEEPITYHFESHSFNEEGNPSAKGKVSIKKQGPGGLTYSTEIEMDGSRNPDGTHTGGVQVSGEISWGN